MDSVSGIVFCLVAIIIAFIFVIIVDIVEGKRSRRWPFQELPKPIGQNPARKDDFDIGPL
jgi:hypothetical protein